MKIVAFLQNMWVKPRQVKTVSKWPPLSEERERMIEYALFAGCLTGRRLKAALGEDVCNLIVWQEANPTIADNPKTYYPPDREHIRAVLEHHKPDMVICFTKAGEAAIREALPPWLKFFPCVHPAARGADTVKQLAELKTGLQDFAGL